MSSETQDEAQSSQGETAGFQNLGKTPQELMQRFHRLQEERVETYQFFDQGFEAYLGAAPNYNFPLYRQLVHEITQTFKNISEEIIGIKTQLQSQYGQNSVAAIMDRIQEAEKNKLEMTAKLQLAVKNVKDSPENETYTAEVTELKQSLKDSVEKINELLEDMKYESEDLYSEESVTEMEVADR